ncbi:MAG TPA: caspase family protein [Allosphingosinicella sp.]|uniref:caspase family protein n=1 Tax=Allosphingosinicella sp. TaxID=2823234 RepID=UPI002EDAD18E
MPELPQPMLDPSLIYDKRAELNAAGKCGFHALLIGVSDYANLSEPNDLPGPGLHALQKLDFPARSAFRIATKLKQLDAQQRLWRPLKTIRLLTAASPLELTNDPELAAAGGAPANWKAIHDALYAWRDDVAKGEDELSLFYFCGHGIRRSLEESILLASDFLEKPGPQLAKSFRLSNVRNGMAPSDEYPNIGRYQFYFVDACRDKPDGLDQLDDTQTPKIFDAALNHFDNRKAPTFFATPPGGLAAGKAGEETYFIKALEWALENASFNRENVDGKDTPIWPTTAQSLKAGLEFADPNLAGRVELTGLISDPILCFRLDPPSLELKVSIAPPALRPSIKHARLIELETGAETDLSGYEVDDPCRVSVVAGFYRIEVEPADGAFQPVKTSIVPLNIRTKMPWPLRIGG